VKLLSARKNTEAMKVLITSYSTLNLLLSMAIQST